MGDALVHFDEPRGAVLGTVEFFSKDIYEDKEEPLLVEACYIVGSAFPQFFATIPRELGFGMELEPEVIEFSVACFTPQDRTAKGQGGGAGEVSEKTFAEVTIEEVEVEPELFRRLVQLRKTRRELCGQVARPSLLVDCLCAKQVHSPRLERGKVKFRR